MPLEAEHAKIRCIPTSGRCDDTTILHTILRLQYEITQQDTFSFEFAGNDVRSDT
jgi:hypothetical protein